MNKNLILHWIGLNISLFAYFAWMWSIILLIWGNNTIRLIITIILIYQYGFARKNEFYRKFLLLFSPHKFFDEYKLIIEEELEQSKCLFSYHPHGIMGFGFGLAPTQDKTLYHSVHCGSRALLNLPVSGLLARWMGVVGVNNKKFVELMERGKNICFIPGGFEEATITEYGKEKVYIKDRKGFIKYALQYGYKVYPCYTFNENKLFYTVNKFEWLRLLFNKIKLPGTIFYGNFLLFPRKNVKLITVVGKPIVLPTIKEPTKDEVNKYHHEYITTLTDLYERHKKIACVKDNLQIY